MTTTPPTTEERLARLEGVYEHLATKTDIANLKTDIANLKTDMADLEVDMANLEARLSKHFTNQIQDVKKSLNRLQGGIAVLGIVVIILQLWSKLPS